MPRFIGAARTVAIAALVGGYALTCPATATADPNSDTLANMLSKGYSTSNCKSHDETDPELQSRGILANYECGQNPLPGGPVKAAYFLFDNSNDAANWFAKFTSTMTTTPCASDDPHTWAAGKLACGGSQTVAYAWTNDQTHMGALLFGADAKSLYQWWLANR
jgi:hypothetical protein